MNALPHKAAKTSRSPQHSRGTLPTYQPALPTEKTLGSTCCVPLCTSARRQPFPPIPARSIRPSRLRKIAHVCMYHGSKRALFVASKCRPTTPEKTTAGQASLPLVYAQKSHLWPSTTKYTCPTLFLRVSPGREKSTGARVRTR